ncbi:hypothetical protein ADL22_03770 [Streptomyces sp. NRRL F-4489]|uniref:hypothetical protein n=1 Tax=Streptomyces sp. NRRL F-4489 TaxID=1609095 RepID=UPI00074A7EF2|nr:hypothetical protein [Streptomyces sp. NRRL F-4489]KUL53438.1 hypothetical protein ADL22_03770 [Streptomyces sp. NRRL F-4489]
MTTLTHRHHTTRSTGTSADGTSAPDTTGSTGSRSGARSRANDMAVASFILGLVGTLVLNIVLGPCALVLGTLALTRGTTRRGRALLGLALGAADLALLAALTMADGTLTWHLG